VDLIKDSYAEVYKAYLTTLIAMANLRRDEGFEAAIDPDRQVRETERLENSADIEADIDTVAVFMKSPTGEQTSQEQLFKEQTFDGEVRSDVGNLIAAVEKDMEKRMQEEAKVAFDAQYDALAENVLRLKENLDQLRDGTYEARKNVTFAEDDDDKDILREAYTETLKANLASLIALDNFRKKGDYSAINDPNRLEEEADRVMTTSVTMRSVMESLFPEKDDERTLGKTLKEAFRALKNRKTLTSKFSQLEKAKQKAEEAAKTEAEPTWEAAGVTENKQAETVVSGQEKEGPEPQVQGTEPEIIPEPEWKAAGVTESQQAETVVTGQEKTETEEPRRASAPVEPKQTGVFEPEPPSEEPRRESAPTEPSRPSRLKLSADSPILRFQAKLEELREDIRMTQESILYELDIYQCRKNLRYLFTLRDMGKTDPYTPVTEDQIKEHRDEIYKAKGSPEYSLYQKVDERIRRGDLSVFRRVVGAIKGNEKADEFAAVVSGAARIKMEDPAVEKQADPTMK